MTAGVQQVQAALARLSPREQRLVAVLAGLAALALAWSLVLEPFLLGRDRVRREIDDLKTELSSLDSMAKQIRQASADGAARRPAAKAGADFSLLAFVEKAAGASLRPESIASMTPSRRPLDGGREEATVELKLSGATFGEVVALLRAVEGEPGPVSIRQFSVKKRYDDASRFDATLVTAATLGG